MRPALATAEYNQTSILYMAGRLQCHVAAFGLIPMLALSLHNVFAIGFIEGVTTFDPYQACMCIASM